MANAVPSNKIWALPAGHQELLKGTKVRNHRKHKWHFAWSSTPDGKGIDR